VKTIGERGMRDIVAPRGEGKESNRENPKCWAAQILGGYQCRNGKNGPGELKQPECAFGEAVGQAKQVESKKAGGTKKNGGYHYRRRELRGRNGRINLKMKGKGKKKVREGRGQAH